MDNPTLSICISTRNRAHFLGETLDSIVGQLEPGVELLVLDGASTDGTPDLMAHYRARYPAIRYRREDQNSGVDQDYDKAVCYALGTYCWLMTDDDLLCAGAVRRVMIALDGADLVIANAEVWSLDIAELLQERRLPLAEDQEYTDRDRKKFFRDCANYLTFIGAVVVNRQKWMSRDRQSYYGSDFIHLGVIFQLPCFEVIRVIGDPLIKIRYGNASWGPRTFEIWAVKFPQLVWSFPDLSEEARAAATDRWPWKDLKRLFYWRAVGAYSRQAFDKFINGEAKGLTRYAVLGISIIPGGLAAVLSTLYLGALQKSERVRIYDLVNGKYAGPVTRCLARSLGLSQLLKG